MLGSVAGARSGYIAKVVTYMSTTGEYYTSEGSGWANGLSVCDHCGEVNDDDSMVACRLVLSGCVSATPRRVRSVVTPSWKEDSTHSDYDGDDRRQVPGQTVPLRWLRPRGPGLQP
jgi:hypothetical protein